MKYLTSIHISENGTPSSIVVTELDDGRWTNQISEIEVLIIFFFFMINFLKSNEKNI